MKRSLIICAALALAASMCVAPVASYAQTRGYGEVARYNFTGKLSTSSTRTGPYSLPARSRLSFQNNSSLGGKVLYIRPFTASGAAYSTAVSTTQTGEKSICGTGSSGIALYPHLWLSNGTQMLNGQYIIRTV